ncbi:MAG: hypothetical protein ABWK00_06365 [Desulfurococcaceae archaeon]
MESGQRKWSRLLKKRELACYVILCDGSRGTFNVGEAAERLVREVGLSWRTALNVVRRLRKMGLLVAVDEVMLECIDPLEYLRGLARSYVERRSSRHHGAAKSSAR